MTEHKLIEALAAEVCDLLDGGPVGLYEFRWPGPVPSGDMSVDDLNKALVLVMASRDVVLAWMRWPFIVEVFENRPPAELPASVWEGIREGQPYLALMHAKDVNS